MVLKQKLLEAAEKNPEWVKNNIQLGERISTNLAAKTFCYQIDDLELYKIFRNGLTDNEFYLELFNRLRLRRNQYIPQIFGETRIADLSRAIELGVGECLEKAILVQLAKQEETDAFFIMGILRHDNMRGGIPHAFNVVYTDGKPFLIDAENPVIIRDGDEKREVPYIVPISDFDGIDFLVDEYYRAGRTYGLDIVRGEPKGKSILDLF